MGLRNALYKVAARIMGDVNALRRGKVGKRVARRTVGKATGHYELCVFQYSHTLSRSCRQKAFF